MNKTLDSIRRHWPMYHGFMEWPDRIVADPDILAGKPVIRGTRIAVEFILELLASGQSASAILSNYPGLTHEDILAALSFADGVPPAQIN